MSILLPYQRRWVEDESRFKGWLAARQIGKSFSVTLEAVLDAAARRTLWVFLSAGERQSKELAEKAEVHLRALAIAAQAFDDEFFDEDGKRYYKQLEQRLPNGSRLLFLPANPATARGYSGNVVLDEFAFHSDSAAIWSALFPTISRNPSYRLRVMSTPNGQGATNKFFQLWNDHLRLGDKDNWSWHRTDIYQAVGEGHPVDLEELRAGIKDDQAWAQEFELQFLDEVSAYLTYELIRTGEDPQATTDLFLDEIDPKLGDLYLGFDVGRQRDLSVIWLLQRVGDVNWTRRVIELHKTSFAAQREILYSLLPRVRRACIDSTGLGMQLAEEAKARFSQVEAVTFSGPVKADMATTLRRAFEDRTVRIPIDDAIREDLHSVKRIVTPAGNIRFDAERDSTGHADRFWALALATHAQSSGGYAPYESMRVARDRWTPQNRR